MSEADAGDDDTGEAKEIAAPRATTEFFGHAAAEKALLESYRGGRIPHAWLIGGPPGIGKATLAFRMARFVLANPDPAATAVQAAPSLAVAPDHPVARRTAGQAHNDLLVLERVIGDNGKLNQDIKVDQVRRNVSFFGSTAGEGGWRVAIVDTVEDLNASGENALLKVLEEPPARSLFFLISRSPGTVRATLRSRCRRLVLRPLAASDVARAAAAATGSDPDAPVLAEAAAAADGSVARALALIDADALAMRKRVLALLDGLPQIDNRTLHALGDTLSAGDWRAFSTLIDAVNGWLSAKLAGGTADKRRLARVAEVWEKVNRSAEEAESFNLDRKSVIFAVFGLLAEAARG